MLVALMSLFSVERPRRLQFGLQLTMSLVCKCIHIHVKSNCLIIEVKVLMLIKPSFNHTPKYIENVEPIIMVSMF